jgi:hypothetical protein
LARPEPAEYNELCEFWFSEAEPFAALAVDLIHQRGRVDQQFPDQG